MRLCRGFGRWRVSLKSLRRPVASSLELSTNSVFGLEHRVFQRTKCTSILWLGGRRVSRGPLAALRARRRDANLRKFNGPTGFVQRPSRVGGVDWCRALNLRIAPVCDRPSASRPTSQPSPRSASSANSLSARSRLRSRARIRRRKRRDFATASRRTTAKSRRAEKRRIAFLVPRI